MVERKLCISLGAVGTGQSSGMNLNIRLSRWSCRCGVGKHMFKRTSKIFDRLLQGVANSKREEKRITLKGKKQGETEKRNMKQEKKRQGRNTPHKPCKTTSGQHKPRVNQKRNCKTEKLKKTQDKEKHTKTKKRGKTRNRVSNRRNMETEEMDKPHR